jgi:hypothetical protein
MKTIIPLTTLAALVASSTAFAQTPAYSKPSGYTTQVLKPSVFNNVGINVQTPSKASGTITAVSGDFLTLTDSSASLTSALTAGKMHTIEITSGTAIGAVREFSSFTGTTVTISAAITGLAVTDKYIIRQNPTLQEIFPVGLLTAAAVTPGTADIVWVPNGSGGYDRYWYKSNASQGAIGWWTTVDGTTRGVQVTEDIPLLFTDGILVQRKGGVDKNLVLTGEVKTTGSTPYILQGFNAVSINPPAGLTLFNAGFAPGSNFAGAAVTPSTADILWVPNGLGGFTQYWYKTNASQGAIGWWTTSDGVNRGSLVSDDVNLPANCYIQRKSTAKFMAINVPSSYSNL